MDFTKSSAKITKTTIVEAVKKVQNYPTMFKLRMPAHEIVNHVNDNLIVHREDKDDIKVARFSLKNPNPEFNRRSYNFLVRQNSSGRQSYYGYDTLVDAVMNFIVYIPEFVEDCRERIDVFI